jgi:hypothetical protein
LQLRTRRLVTIETDAVTTAKILDDFDSQLISQLMLYVTTAKIADVNVTTAKIADAAVTNAKIR